MGEFSWQEWWWGVVKRLAKPSEIFLLLILLLLLFLAFHFCLRPPPDPDGAFWAEQIKGRPSRRTLGAIPGASLRCPRLAHQRRRAEEATDRDGPMRLWLINGGAPTKLAASCINMTPPLPPLHKSCTNAGRA